VYLANNGIFKFNRVYIDSYALKKTISSLEQDRSTCYLGMAKHMGIPAGHEEYIKFQDVIEFFKRKRNISCPKDIESVPSKALQWYSKFETCEDLCTLGLKYYASDALVESLYTLEHKVKGNLVEVKQIVSFLEGIYYYDIFRRYKANYHLFTHKDIYIFSFKEIYWDIARDLLFGSREISELSSVDWITSTIKKFLFSLGETDTTDKMILETLSNIIMGAKEFRDRKLAERIYDYLERYASLGEDIGSWGDVNSQILRNRNSILGEFVTTFDFKDIKKLCLYSGSSVYVQYKKNSVSFLDKLGKSRGYVASFVRFDGKSYDFQVI
jgi:hypothetical protein